MQWHETTARQALEMLRSDAGAGLTQASARERLERYGENTLRTKKPPGFWRRFLTQFSDFMIWVLLAAAVVSFATARLRGESGVADPLVILGIVVLNAVIGAVQQTRAQKALDALRQMSAPQATVLRDGKQMQIDASQVTVGDVLLLSAGDRVAADARLLECVGMTTQESALTGESMPCEKDAQAVLPADCPPADRRNMLYASATVLTGHGRAVVCETGMRTQIGAIADMLQQQDAPKTPLQIKLDRVGHVLGIGALVICGAIFLLSVLHHVPAADSFLLAVSLAVAAIPEGLPAVVTVVLSLGVQRMAKRGAILTSLPAVETLGAAGVICSDKTGTLTQGRMTVTRQYVPSAGDRERLLRGAALCCNADVTDVHGRRETTGAPTEIALLEAAAESMDTDALRRKYPRIDELPFDPSRKKMSTLHRANGGYLQVTKGAPELLLPLCGSVYTNGEAQPMDESTRRSLLACNAEMASQALRVLAVAYRVPAQPVIEESGLTLLGLIGLSDPPRPESAPAVQQCRQAGIVPVMITGDQAVTAKAIARQIGICGEDGTVMIGSEIEQTDDALLREKVGSCRVFARVTPQHKVRIVRAFRSRGAVVAMTGDGVNDAPALKCADIGCAMGKSGTDVAKGAADMILTDDNFATIVRAVAEGRGIYDNIRKAVHFLLSSNVGEILVIFASSVLRLPTPLLPIQLLWVNFVTDSLPALALGTEPPEENVMSRPPVGATDGLFAAGMGADIALEGMLIGAATLLAFVRGCHLEGEALGRTMAFTTLSLGEIAYAVSMRSHLPLCKAGLFKNKKMVWAVLLCTLLQGAVLTLPTLSSLFQTVPMHGAALVWTLGCTAFPFAVLEAEKLFRGGSSRGRLYGFVGRFPVGRFLRRLPGRHIGLHRQRRRRSRRDELCR